MVDPAEGSGHRQQRLTAYSLVSSGYDTQRYVRVCAHRLVELIGLRSGAQVLDVATGTGWAAMAAGRTVDPAGQVVGVDLTPGMLQEARRTMVAADLTNVEVREGDAEHLDCADESFDAVLCASALFFLPHMREVLLEWQRVLRPGGRVAFSAFGATLFQPMMTMLTDRLQTYGVSLPPRRPRQRLATPERCRDLLQEAGFSDLEVRTEQLGYYLSDANAYWEDTVRWNGSRRDLLSQVPPDKLDQFRAEHLADVSALATDQGIWVDNPCIFALGRKS
jgi:ubiquinone/menaquinone biosynthesis C-methylase UbiE